MFDQFQEAGHSSYSRIGSQTMSVLAISLYSGHLEQLLRFRWPLLEVFGEHHSAIFYEFPFSCKDTPPALLEACFAWGSYYIWPSHLYDDGLDYLLPFYLVQYMGVRD